MYNDTLDREEELDLDLLDAMLDALAADLDLNELSNEVSKQSPADAVVDYEPSYQVIQQLERESDITYQTLIFQLHDQADWLLCQQELLTSPVLCLDCRQQYCDHIVAEFTSSSSSQVPVVHLWTDAMLAVYTLTEVSLSLESGQSN